MLDKGQHCLLIDPELSASAGSWFCCTIFGNRVEPKIVIIKSQLIDLS